MNRRVGQGSKGAEIDTDTGLVGGKGALAQPLAIPQAEKQRSGRFERKAKRDPANPDEQATVTDSQDSGAADAEAIVLAQAPTEADGALSVADAEAAASSGGVQSPGPIAPDMGTSMTRQGIGIMESVRPGVPDAGMAAAGAAPPASWAGATATAETAVLASGSSPLLGLPLLGLAAGGGGGGKGGGGSATPTPIAPPAATAGAAAQAATPAPGATPVASADGASSATRAPAAAPATGTDATTPGTPAPAATPAAGTDGTPPGTPATPIPANTVLLKGTVSDGYVSGARIYIDVNGDGKPDTAEDTGASTDSSGHYSLESSLHGSIIAVGGTNIDTGLPNTLVLLAPAGSTVVSPLTTLVQQYVNSRGVSVSAAEAAVELMFALPQVDLTSYDPLAAADPIDATALQVQKAAAQLAVLMILADDYSAGAAAAMTQSIVDLIAAGATVDLGDAATLAAINTMAGGMLSAAQIAYIAAGTADIAQDTTLAMGASGSISESQQAILTGQTAPDAQTPPPGDPAPGNEPGSAAATNATVSLSATAVVAAGDSITYTASVGASPALQELTVELDNGLRIVIAAGQTSGTVTALAQANLNTSTPGVQTAAIAGVSGNGGFGALSVDTTAASTAVGYVLSDTGANLLFLFDAATLGAATALNVTDAITVADAEALLALNSGTSYSLYDTAAKLASAPAPLGDGAGDITVLGPATAAEAAAIDAFANSGITSYSLSDSVSNLAALLAIRPGTIYSLSDTASALLSSGAASIVSSASSVTVSEPASLTQAAALLALNPVSSYGLSDTAFELLNPSNAATVAGAAAVAVSDAMLVADANALLQLNANTFYSLVDNASELLAPANAALVGAATTVEAVDFISVADVEALLALNASASYLLQDSAANLLLPANAPAVGNALGVAVNAPVTVAAASALMQVNALTYFDLLDTAANVLADPLVAAAATTVEATGATVAQADALMQSYPFSLFYDLNDTAAHLQNAPDPETLRQASSVTVSDAATVAQAAAIHGVALTAHYDIADAAATVAAALGSGSPSLPAVTAANTIDVTGTALTLNADAFTNLLAGSALFAANDTIAIDGDLLAGLGTLHPFGGDTTHGLTLGGAQNGAYLVDLGTSGESLITMEGTGQQRITAASGTTETFVMGASATDGLTDTTSLISNLGVGDMIDTLGAASPNLTTQVATGTQVTGPGLWAFNGGVLTWWDAAHNGAEELHLSLAAGATALQLLDQHTFKVI